MNIIISSSENSKISDDSNVININVNNANEDIVCSNDFVGIF